MSPFGTEGTSEPYSFHTGVVNALMGDASVCSISASIPAATFAALITRAGGEIASGDF